MPKLERNEVGELAVFKKPRFPTASRNIVRGKSAEVIVPKGSPADEDIKAHSGEESAAVKRFTQMLRG